MNPKDPRTWSYDPHGFARGDEHVLEPEALAALGVPERREQADGAVIMIEAAALDPDTGTLLWMEIVEREAINQMIRIHVRGPDGAERSWPIKSYNVAFFTATVYCRWLGGWGFAIYLDKHEYVLARAGVEGEPVFRGLGDLWILREGVLGHMEHGDARVQRLRLPGLEPMEPVPFEEAERDGFVPHCAFAG